MRWLVAVGVWLLSTNAPAACEQAVGVRLNELMPYPQDSDPEWVELVNTGPLTAELEGWVVETSTRSAASWSDAFTIPSGVSLAPGQRVVLGGMSVVFPGAWVVNVEQGATFGNNSTAEDGARLVDCAGAVMDVVVYGASVEGEPFVDEEGESVIAEKLAPRSREGQSLARSPDGADTNNGLLDFLSGPATPGLPNETTPGGGGAGCTTAGVRGAVLINELLPAPGALSNPDGDDSGWEWLELYNPAATPVDIGGWQVHQAGSPGDWGTRVRYELPPGTVIVPGGWLVISDPLATFDEGVAVLRLTEGSLGLGNSQDGARLVSCDGVVVDQVVYGGSNPDGFADLDGELLEDGEVAGSVKDDLSLARRADGYSDGSYADAFVLTGPTPGASNVDLTCKSGLADGANIRINELFANPKGTDSEAQSEWIELYNAGGQTFDLSTWSIVKSSGLNDDLELPLTTMYTFGAGVDIGPGDYLVLAAIQAEQGDIFAEVLDFPSGTNGDLVFLQSCFGERVDGVVYGGSNEDRAPEDNGVVPATAAPYPSEDACVLRRQDGVDTDQSLRDFVLSRYCTPGASNVPEGGGGSGDPTGPKGGCGVAGPRSVEARDVSGGCAVAPGWSFGALGLLLVARRRRR